MSTGRGCLVRMKNFDCLRSPPYRARTSSGVAQGSLSWRPMAGRLPPGRPPGGGDDGGPPGGPDSDIRGRLHPHKRRGKKRGGADGKGEAVCVCRCGGPTLHSPAT